MASYRLAENVIDCRVMAALAFEIRLIRGGGGCLLLGNKERVFVTRARQIKESAGFWTVSNSMAAIVFRGEFDVS